MWTLALAQWRGETGRSPRSRERCRLPGQDRSWRSPVPAGQRSSSPPWGLTGDASTGDKAAGGEQRREGGECVPHPAVRDSRFPGQRKEVFLTYLFQQKHPTWGHPGEGCLGRASGSRETGAGAGPRWLARGGAAGDAGVCWWWGSGLLDVFLKRG